MTSSYNLEVVHAKSMDTNTPPPYWDESSATFLTDGHPQFTGILSVSCTDALRGSLPPFWIICGFYRTNLSNLQLLDQTPWVFISCGPDEYWNRDSDTFPGIDILQL